MKMISKPVNLRFFSKNLTYIGFVMMVFVLFVSLFSLEGLKLFTASTIYWEANNIIPLLSMAVFIGVMKDYSSESMLILKNTRSIALFVLITGLFNVGMNYLLIPTYDIYGASVSTFLSQLLLWILIFRKSQKMLYIPFEISKILKLIFVGSLILIIGIFIVDFALVWRLIIKFSMILVFPFILYIWNFYEEIELNTIRNIFQAWKNPKEIRANLNRLMRTGDNENGSVSSSDEPLDKD
jgi:O-antigen/teichoic acid export membrane protein